MMKKCLFLCLLVSVACVFEAGAWPHKRAKANPKVNTSAEKQMDRNRDGWVQPKEAAAAKHHGYFRHRAEVNRPWESAADRDNDGYVDGAELRAYHLVQLDTNHDGRIGKAERISYWHHRWIANTELERKYDQNGDGYLEWPEAVEILKDKHALIMTRGRAKVNTDLELEFDTNDDGVIDRSEAPALLTAIEAAD